jgi:hypothetical protein
MKDLHTVLRQKEQDVERVRREILALLTVIPLLTNDKPEFDIIPLLRSRPDLFSGWTPPG